MKYDFTTLPDRRGQGAVKWESMRKIRPDVGADVVPLSIADMEFLNPPEIMEGLKTFLDRGVLGYTEPTEAYFEAVISWMKRRKKWNIAQDSIVCSAGVIPALYTAVRAFTNPGDGVLIMTPAYPPFYEAVRRNGRQVVASSLLCKGQSYEMDFADIEEKTRPDDVRLLFLCNPHNPTGRVWTRSELETLGEICLRNHLVVVADEIHSDLLMPGVEHTVFASLNPALAQSTLTCTAPSKTFNLAGMQTSNIIIENLEIRQAFREELFTSTGGDLLNVLGYEACRIAYTQCEAWLEELNRVIWDNHCLVRSFMAENMPWVRVFPLEGTYLQWLDFRAAGLTYQAMEDLHIRKAQVFLDEGHIFGAEGEGFERVNLACPKRILQESLERLRESYELLDVDAKCFA